MSYIQIRIDDELKELAINLFNDLGLDLSTAIRLFLKKSVDEKKLPFVLETKSDNALNDVKYRLKVDVMVPSNTAPFKVMDEFNKLCEENKWHYVAGGIQYPQNTLIISKKDEGIYYHGSPYKIETLKANYDFTPYKEIAIAFGSKPAHISVKDGRISYDGITYPIYLYQINEDIKLDEDFINHPNSVFEEGMELRAKRNLKLKLIDVINE